MKIKINGIDTTTKHITLLQILMENNISLETSRVAVAINDCVIVKSKWNECNINCGDTVEIVKPFQGG